MIKKIISVLMVLVILSISLVSFATTEGEINDQIKDIDGKIDQAKDDIKDIETKVDDALNEISKLTAQITEKQEEVATITSELNTLNEEIATLEKELKEKEQKYNEQYESLKARIVAQYKMGNVSYLDVLLNSKSLSDFISRYYIIEKVAEYDTKLLDIIEEQKTIIENTKKEVEKKKNEASEKKAKLKLEEITLSNKKTNKNKMVSKLNDEQKKLQDEVDKWDQQRENLYNELREIARKNSQTNSGYIYTGGQLQWPAPSYTRISSEFGYRGSAATGGVGTAYHRGLDMAAPKGSPVLAAESGTVIKTYVGCPHNYGSKCGCGGTLGNYIMISHGGGLTTLYGHCTSVNVSVGQNVSRGQQIGTVGSTGNSTGFHLHFSVLKKGSYVNPSPYLGR